MNSLLHGSSFLRRFYPSLVWQKKTAENEVFLTFDDGPEPEVTRFVLDTLDNFGYKATFFCIGNNVKKNPETYKEITNRGHSIGNHTQNHKNGFKASLSAYMSEAEQASMHIDSKLFRPPYGRIRRDQMRGIKRMGFEIIMWSILAGDFDAKLDVEKALNEMKKRTVPGSVIVFHDSLKAYKQLQVLLPAYCSYLQENGFRSCSL